MKWRVTMPITGYISIEVEADSKREALDAAWEADLSACEIEEWNVHEHVTEGNVFHGTLNSAYVEKVKP